jgi:ribose transport system substrate-binding protein
MKRRSFLGAASALALGLSIATTAIAQDKEFTIALVPGLTTDAFYITMQKPQLMHWVSNLFFRVPRTLTR